MPLTVNPKSEIREEFFKDAKEADERNGIRVTLFKEKAYELPAISIPLSFLVTYPYRLKKTIPLVIEKARHSDLLIAGNEEFNKYGIGATTDEAIKEFEKNIIEDFSFLRNSLPGKLTRGAKELLTLYESYIEM